jgi:hypothetical protein
MQIAKNLALQLSLTFSLVASVNISGKLRRKFAAHYLVFEIL